MPKPTVFPDWDTNATNTSAPVAGHVTDGFANNEVPTAAELNEWMRRAGLWCKYVSTDLVSRTVPVPLAGGVNLTNISIVAPKRSMHASGAWHWESLDAGAWGLVDGDRILTVTMRMKSVLGNVWNLSLYKQDSSTASPSPTLIQTTALTCGSSSGITDITLTISSPTAISAHDVWYVEADGGASGDDLQAVWVTVDRA